MINELLFSGFTATVGVIIGSITGFLIAKKIAESKHKIYEDQAKAKANVIEQEAQIILHKASLEANQLKLEAKKRYEEVSIDVKKDLQERENEISKKEYEFQKYFDEETQNIESKKITLKNKKLDLDRNLKSVEKLKKMYEQKSASAITLLESHSGLTQEEAKAILLEQVKERSRIDLAHEVRRIESENKVELRKKANYILAQATTRFAGEFAAERLVNSIHLKDDELKGRIIGKEGRNIKILENLLGVDIIIDDTPHEILVSSFNLYRRAIATKTLELLIEDGRIQPARIEEIYAKVSEEFEDEILHEGESVIFDLGVGAMHPELMKLLGKLRFRASYGQNALAHTIEVAELAGIMAAELGGNIKLAKRAGLLHDIGKALTQEIEGNHVDIGADLCRKYDEDDVVINAIYAHHGYEEVKSIECAAVCAADALSAARPGARREVLESFITRVSELEEIAGSKEGVSQAFAINAGRELRVIVNAKLVNDDESVLLAKEIASEIQDRVNFPGDIKVNVIRETRAIEMAY